MPSSDLTDRQRDFIQKYIAPIKAAAPASNPWTKFRADLEPRILEALKANHPEAGKIRASWAFAEEQAEAGDVLAAIAAGNRIETVLAAGSGQGDVPVGTVAFQRSRIMWISAKNDMKQGIDTFRNAVVSQAADDEDREEIIAAVEDLVSEFEAFDDRLEDQLDQITQTPEGPERTKLKTVARKTVDDYIDVLGGPFFSVIDNNPFVSVKVAARGQQSLSTISATLS